MGKTFQSITIDAPADKVWAAISDFSDMSWSPNVVTDLQVVGKVGGRKSAPGAYSTTRFTKH